MMDQQIVTGLLILLTGVAGLLGLFTAVIFWAVKRLNQGMQTHMDAKLDGISSDVKQQSRRIDDHDKQIQEQHIAQFRLRSELLEDLSNRYVRHDDIVHIKESTERLEKVQHAIFERMDKMIFNPGGNS